MLLKKSSKVYISIVVILIAILVVFSFDWSKNMYGNDEESITKVITSIEGYENESIEILEIKDMYDVRVVSFLSDNNPGYIQFTKNRKDNYEWRHIEKSSNKSFATFLIHKLYNEDKFVKVMIITNQDNDIAKMDLSVNEQVIQQEFNINQKSVTWIELPESKEETYRFEYKYYDENGKLVGDN